MLAALGINTFFSGAGATDIALRGGLTAALVAAATNHLPADNSNALRLAGLAETALAPLGGMSLNDYYRELATELGGRTAEAQSQLDASDTLVEALAAQRDAISGVSLDEEAIELMKYQRAFQGAARYITVIDELLDELVRLI